MLFKKTLLAVAALAFVGSAAAVPGSTATSSFNVRMTVTSNCLIKTAPVDISLGSVAAGAAVTPGSTSIVVNCSKGTLFTVGLLPSNNDTAGAGKMTGPALTDLIPYQLHQTTATGAVWGNTPGTNTMAGTGLGMASILAQEVRFTAFATVLAADTDAATLGAYTDRVAVTVTY